MDLLKDSVVIAEYIKNSLLRVVGKELSISIHKCTDKTYTLETSGFNTIPVLFKNINITGDIFTSDYEENEDYEQIHIRFSYKFEYFNSGTNGIELGYMTLLSHKQFPHIVVKSDFTYAPQNTIRVEDGRMSV